MSEKKMKAAIIGKGSSAALYTAAGVAAFETGSPSELSKTVTKLYNNGFGIIFVAETLYREGEDAMKKYLTEPYPIIIPVPDENSDGTYAKERIAENVKKAVGSDLI